MKKYNKSLILSLNSMIVAFIMLGCGLAVEESSVVEESIVSPPSGLSYIIEENSTIFFSWELPSDNDFQKVVLLKNDQPIYVYDQNSANFTVYEGSQTFYVETVLQRGVQIYYSLFAINESEAVSEPIITNIRLSTYNQIWPMAGLNRFNQQKARYQIISPSITNKQQIFSVG